MLESSLSEASLSEDLTPPTPTDRTTLGGDVREYHWTWKSQTVKVVYEVLGEGKPMLLLPAFSSVSTRLEMKGLATQLSRQFQVVVPDWVGFGDSDRPPFQYAPDLYQRFLRDFVRSIFSEPVVVIAAGHAAGYVMKMGHDQPSPWKWVVLVAPTWHGPLPTAMGDRPKVYGVLRSLVRLPVVGQFLYKLNTTHSFLGWMYRRHVYANPDNVTSELLEQKFQTTQKPGARFASAAFVTGALDPVRGRSEFLDLFHSLPVPVLAVIGERTPPKSLREMEVLAHFSRVQSYRMPGALGMHEEYPEYLVDGILPFLKKYLS